MPTLVNVPVKAGDRVLVPGDIHFPTHDERALEAMTDLAYQLGVTKMFAQGDTFDYYGLSVYPKSADRMRILGRLEDEAKAGKPWFGLWAKLFECWVGPGNHEDRWYDLVDKHPALEGLEWTSPLEEAGVLDGWHALGRNYRAKMGSLIVEHGDNLSGVLRRNSAASVLQEYPGQNTLYGHTHRIDSCSRPTRKDGEPVSHGAWSVGHMSDEIKSGEYMETKAWEKGFAIVDFWEAGSELRFTVHQARVFSYGKKGDRRVVNLMGRTAKG